MVNDIWAVWLINMVNVMVGFQRLAMSFRSLSPSIRIFEADDIVFAQIVARLDFD